MASFLLVAAGLLSLASAAYKPDNFTAPKGYDPIQNFCRRVDHQSTVLNGKLYIDGGRQTYAKWVLNTTDQNYWWTGNMTKGNNPYLIEMDMTASWDWKTNITIDARHKVLSPDVPDTIKSKNLKAPNLIRGALWNSDHDSEHVWFYGGTSWDEELTFDWPVKNSTKIYDFQPPQSDEYTLWKMEVATGYVEPVQLDKKITRSSDGAGIAAPDKHMAFYLGGVWDEGSTNETWNVMTTKAWMTGMLVFDLKAGTVRNVSTAGLNARARANAQFVYIPEMGEEGILVLLGGGYKKPSEVDNYSDWQGDMVSMGDVTVFDIASLRENNNTGDGKWYIQKATGTIPEAREDHCLVVASSPDNSSHNIYMYGGQNVHHNNTGFDTIDVLSLPSFTWINVFERDSYRDSHTCHRIGRQMLTVGGQFAGNMTANWGCDWEYRSIAVYDLTNLTWGSEFNIDAPDYQVPVDIFSQIGGGPDGKATKLEPSNGWTSPELKKALFPNSEEKLSTGAIAGIAVGIAALVTIVVFAIWYFAKRRPVLLAKSIDEESKSRTPDIPEMHANSVPEMSGENKFVKYFERSAELDTPVYEMATPDCHEMDSVGTSPIVMTPGTEGPPEYDVSPLEKEKEQNP